MICTECVIPIPLKKLIAGQGGFGDCQYCQKPGMCLQDETVLEYIKERILESFRTLEELSHIEQHIFFHGSDKITPSEFWAIVQDDYTVGTDAFVERAINYLEEDLALDEHGETQIWALDDGTLARNVYEERWQKFVLDTHHGYRFFNFAAKEFLDSLFDFACHDKKLRPELLTTLKDDQLLFRARKVSERRKCDEFDKFPETALGPAPAAKAGDQRMTPSGISAMYCAFDRETCLSEIRAITGDLVVSGAFTPVTQLKFLDLRMLQEMSKISAHPFDKGYVETCHAHRFLCLLINKLSKPKSSSDTLGYISTQVVFEYLRLRFKGQVSGLIFPSVQTGLVGTNAVLFPESAVIAPKGYKIENEDPLGHSDPFSDPIPTLQFRAGSLVWHKIKAVKTQSEDYDDLMDYVLADF
jgi:hypothetical protein